MALYLAGIHSGPVEWVTPLGEFSGAQFAGIWLGVSPVFQALGGIAEVAAGLLLLTRKTTTLGAMIAVGTFTNSLMLHLGFRPSPWLGDALLLGLSSYLVLLDWRVLFDLLLLDRPTTPGSLEGEWETALTRKIGVLLKVAFLVYCAYASGFQLIRMKHDADAQSDLSGAYLVASFSPNNANVQHRWHEAAIDRYAERFSVRTVDGSGETFRIEPAISPGSTSGHREHVAAIAKQRDRLSLVAPDGSVWMLNCSRTPSGSLELSGELEGMQITADLQPIAPNSLPFVNQDIYFPQPR